MATIETLNSSGVVEIYRLQIAACTGYAGDGQPGCGSPFIREVGTCGFVHWKLCSSCAGCGCEVPRRAVAKLERAIKRFVSAA